ncbi:uncharacterized protein [Epargyreus clarus]|uniref:uncharacterized protein n=1 Tax=Epargyreus clarus TaxID=520877 RepID=UPI003C2C266E
MACMTKKCLRLGLLNARSLNTGKDELFIAVLNHKPDILAINETWLKSGEEALAPVLPKYRFLHKPRLGKKGGGVGFYVKEGIKTKLQRHPTSALEQMWLEVQLPGSTLALGTAYRPESVGLMESLDALSESMNLMASCELTCILGDFNIDMSNTQSNKSKEILQFCQQHSLEQLIKEPTRITDNSQTILDLVMTNMNSKCKKVEVIHNHSLSDHALVVVDFDIKKPKLGKQFKLHRALHNINLNQFADNLRLIPWEYIHTLDTVDEMQNDVLELKPTTETEVEKILYTIKTKAAGHDSLNIEMIKMTLDVTLPVITSILNKSIETCTFPSCWKKALIKPIPKKTCVSELKDLRPISILPVLSKILEKIVLDQVLKYLENKDIIPKYQSGFRRGHGTETALLHVTDDLTEASDMGMSSIMVLLDYSRAFDCLDPGLLLKKLKIYGFSENTCRWFRDFLTNRQQMVVTDDKHGNKNFSSLVTLQRGVPQGSILSPILFSIFTADLPKHIQHCNYHLYADDTQLYYSFDSKNTHMAIKKINDDLNSILLWSQNNSLVLNPLKSQYLVLGTKKQIKSALDNDIQIKMNDVILQQVSSARNLGLILDGEQKFVEYTNNRIKTAFYKLKTLYQIRPYIREELRTLLCDSLVLSQFIYCSSTFGPRINSYTERAIQRVQNACIPYCFNVPKRECITPYLNRKGILNMRARRELHYACTVHRVIWNKKPEYLFEKLHWVKDISSRSLRSHIQNLLITPTHSSRRYRGCFKFAAASIWNDLPPPLRKKMSTESFKAKYSSALLRRQIAAENLKHAHWKSFHLREFFA